MRGLFAYGHKPPKIAELEQVSLATIRKDIKSFGIVKTDDVGKRRDRVQSLAQIGKTAPEMAQELKVSIGTIRKDLKAKGITAVRKQRVPDSCGLPHRRVSTDEMFRTIIEKLEEITTLLKGRT